LVALAANDLLLDDLAIEPFAPPSSIAVAKRAPPTIAVMGSAANQWGPGMLGGLAIDYAIPKGRRVLAVEAGLSQLVDGALDLTGAVVRAGVGIRASVFELRANATVAPIFVDDGIGDETILFGIGASARLRIPVATDVRMVLGIGAELFATRTYYVANGMDALVTPRIAPWLSAGIEVTR
jgi:hypothetical protein